MGVYCFIYKTTGALAYPRASITASENWQCFGISDNLNVLILSKMFRVRPSKQKWDSAMKDGKTNIFGTELSLKTSFWNGVDFTGVHEGLP